MTELPSALAPLAAFDQFLLWRNANGTKLPCDITGRVVDAHEAMNRTDAETACAMATLLGLGVAFVLTADDPFFCIDIDHALQPDGTWSDIARDLCARFAGAAVEVSQSGTGLHIFGTYTGPEPLHRSKNISLGLELYTSNRFIATTGTNAVGDAGQDCTAPLYALIAEHFPPRTAADGVADGWTNTPRPEWNGPADDTSLIRRALQSRSASSVFGTGASFADLWECNTDVLAGAYPDRSGLRGYDASGADAALAQHLAFWAGCDCERIKRLMLQSALVRPKWDREDYLERTILNACRMQRDVLKDAPAAPAGPAIAASPLKQTIISDVAALLKRPVTAVTYVVNGWMPEGLTLLVASPKVGKSTLILQIAVALASGGSFWGHQQPASGVLIIDLETNERRLRRKLEAAGLTTVPEGMMLYATTWQRGAAGIAEIAETLKSRPHIRLVVIDTLQRFRDAGNGRQNAYAADYEALAPLQQLCRDTPGLAIVCVHHKRKAAVDDPIDSINGSAAIAGAADSIWIMSRKAGDFFLTIQARDWEREEDEFRIERAGGGWRLADGQKLTESDAQTLGHLQSAEGISGPALGNLLGIGRQAAFERLKRLELKGLAIHDGKAWKASP